MNFTNIISYLYLYREFLTYLKQFSFPCRYGIYINRITEANLGCKVEYREILGVERLLSCIRCTSSSNGERLTLIDIRGRCLNDCERNG